MMDLEEDCPHCSAKAGEICKEDCTAHGKVIRSLKRLLNILGLTLDNVKVKV